MCVCVRAVPADLLGRRRKRGKPPPPAPFTLAAAPSSPGKALAKRQLAAAGVLGAFAGGC